MGQLHKVLSLLADGNFHSGEVIGKKLQVSRSAIWKTLKHCRNLEIDLHTVRGRGYRIPGGMELLNSETITQSLNQKNVKRIVQLDILDCVDSTNQYLLNLKTNLSGYVCLAEKQVAGRGRRGRQWLSPYGHNIYLSLLWHFSLSLSRLGGLSLVVGIAVIKALQRYGLADLSLKWPNDILYQDKKLGGILVEISGDVAEQCRVVIGVGINTNMPKNTAEKIDQPWIDVASIIETTPSRNAIAGNIIDELLTMLPQFQQQGFTSFLKEWQQFDSIHQQTVYVHTANEVLEGTAEGIDEQGNLLLKSGGKLHTFCSGEVSVRKMCSGC